jgi:acyl-CoA thioester hydrolase
MTDEAKQELIETRKATYKHWTEVNLRFGDTDRQGHINNSVYATLYESGRFAFFQEGFKKSEDGQHSITLARVAIDFRIELYFPGTVSVGSRILSVGKSSLKLGQAIFKDEICHSISDSVLVFIDLSTRRSTPFTKEMLSIIEHLKRD